MKINKKILRLCARRGLLENDLILNKYLDQNEDNMSKKEIEAFLLLTKISDINLINLFFLKKKINKKNDLKFIKEILKKINNIHIKKYK